MVFETNVPAPTVSARSAAQQAQGAGAGAGCSSPVSARHVARPACCPHLQIVVTPSYTPAEEVLDAGGQVLSLENVGHIDAVRQRVRR